MLSGSQPHLRRSPIVIVSDDEEDFIVEVVCTENKESKHLPIETPTDKPHILPSSILSRVIIPPVQPRPRAAPSSLMAVVQTPGSALSRLPDATPAKVSESPIVAPILKRSSQLTTSRTVQNTSVKLPVQQSKMVWDSAALAWRRTVVPATSGGAARGHSLVPRSPIPSLSFFPSAHAKAPGAARSRSAKLAELKSDLVREKKALSLAPLARRPGGPVLAPPVLERTARKRDTESEGEASDDMSDLKDAFERDADQWRPSADRTKRTVQLIDLPTVRPHSSVIARQKVEDKKQREARLNPSLNDLYRHILAMDMTALKQGRCGLTLKAVPDRFSGVDEYRKVFEPLLFAEFQEQVLKCEAEHSTEEDFSAMIIGVDRVGDFHVIKFLRKETGELGISENDFLLLTYADGKPFLKMISSLNDSPTDGASAAAPEAQQLTIFAQVESCNNRTREFTAKVFFSKEKRSHFALLVSNMVWRIANILNLTTVSREYQALIGLRHYPLVDRILSPPPVDPTVALADPPVSLVRHLKGHFNEPQVRAIAAAVRQIGFTLIQGPPGTGKTRTTIAIVATILTAASQLIDSNEHLASSTGRGQPMEQKPLKKRILICAPSNAAIDEIVQRLKAGVTAADGTTRQLNLVRIGKSESIHPAVKALTLEYLVERELVRTGSQLQTAHATLDFTKDAITGIRGSLRSLDEEISAMTQAYSSAEEESAAKKDLKRSLDGLHQRRRDLFKQLQTRQTDERTSAKMLDAARHKWKLKLLTEADVVCCTLSSSARDILLELSTGFDTVIIDEAAQAVELTTLIPLKYNCTRCILIGDPNQLPATVFSKQAQNYAYEQSLFQRIQRCSPKSVFLLSIQYRMHPEISYFPGKHFYRLELVDGAGLAESRARPYHLNRFFEPYLFYDTIEGRENKGRLNTQSRSLFNATEAEAVLGLLSNLCTHFPNVSVRIRHSRLRLAVLINECCLVLRQNCSHQSVQGAN